MTKNNDLKKKLRYDRRKDPNCLSYRDDDGSYVYMQDFVDERGRITRKEVLRFHPDDYPDGAEIILALDGLDYKEDLQEEDLHQHTDRVFADRLARYHCSGKTCAGTHHASFSRLPSLKWNIPVTFQRVSIHFPFTFQCAFRGNPISPSKIFFVRSDTLRERSESPPGRMSLTKTDLLYRMSGQSASRPGKTKNCPGIRGALLIGRPIRRDHRPAGRKSFPKRNRESDHPGF